MVFRSWVGNVFVVSHTKYIYFVKAITSLLQPLLVHQNGHSFSNSAILETNWYSLASACNFKV